MLRVGDSVKSEQKSKFQISKFQPFKKINVGKFQFSEFPNFKVSEFQVSKLQRVNDSRFQNLKVSQINFMISDRSEAGGVLNRDIISFRSCVRAVWLPSEIGSQTLLVAFSLFPF